MPQKMTLKAARINAGLKQQEAAKKLGISVSTLKSWEYYQTFPTYPKIVKICNLYNADFDTIIFAN